VRMLLLCADRDDSGEEGLLISAYEALNIVLDSAPNSANETLGQILKVMLERLEKTFTMEILNHDDVSDQNLLQGLLCGVLQVLVTKLGKQLKPVADSIMKQLIILFRSKKDTSVYEEGMLTVNAVVTIMEGDMGRYLTDLLPHLLIGLSNWQAHQVCKNCVGVIGDISRNITSQIAPHCDKIITVLLTNLQNRDLDRAVKPTILSVFGDIAWAIGGSFDKYLSVVLNMLKQAAETVMKTKIDDEDYELIDYLNQLREGICEAYTGIIQGMRQDHKADKMFGNLNDIMQFVLHIAMEKQCSESVRRDACGIVGDLVKSYASRVLTAVQHVEIQKLIIDCHTNKEYSDETHKLGNWARQLCQI